MEQKRPVIVLENDLKKEVWLELFRIGRERGWTQLDLRFSGNEIPRGLKPIGAFVNKLPDDPFVKRLRDMGCHVIRLGIAPHPADHLVPAVLPDLWLNGVIAAEHFAARAFRHVAFVQEKHGGMFNKLYEGFRTRALELNCECHSFHWPDVVKEIETITMGTLYRKRAQLFKKWISTVPKPLGFFAFHDWRACFYNRLCSDAGFEMPSQIGILGVGNDEMICETVYPSLSSIVLDDKAFAEKAVEMFDQLSKGQKPEKTTVLIPPSDIVIRQSTDIFAASTPGVTKAIRFMINHYTEPITVNDIAKATGMSRARLFVAFEDDLGQPPGAILTQIRTDKAKYMLRNTDEKIITIANACGFGAAINMAHHFKQQTGMTPTEYRKSKECEIN